MDASWPRLQRQMKIKLFLWRLTTLSGCVSMFECAKYRYLRARREQKGSLPWLALLSSSQTLEFWMNHGEELLVIGGFSTGCWKIEFEVRRLKALGNLEVISRGRVDAYPLTTPGKCRWDESYTTRLSLSLVQTRQAHIDIGKWRFFCGWRTGRYFGSGICMPYRQLSVE